MSKNHNNDFIMVPTSRPHISADEKRRNLARHRISNKTRSGKPYNLLKSTLKKKTISKKEISTSCDASESVANVTESIGSSDSKKKNLAAEKRKIDQILNGNEEPRKRLKIDPLKLAELNKKVIRCKLEEVTKWVTDLETEDASLTARKAIIAQELKEYRLLIAELEEELRVSQTSLSELNTHQ